MRIQDYAEAAFQRVLHRTKTCVSCEARSSDTSGKHSPFSTPVLTALTLSFLILNATRAMAQTQGPLYPQSPPQARNARVLADGEPPILDPAKASRLMKAALSPVGWPEPQPSLPDLPAQVVILAEQHIPVVLDTPLSTVASKQGQIVTFRTVYSLPLGDGLELPAETQILGHVVEVKRPAHFGREGELRIAIDRIRLDPDGGATLAAHLDSSEMKGPGRFANENTRSTDLHAVAIDSAGSALVGAVVDGAKGAGIGAGAGAAIAVLILKSPRGQDVYLEQGMRFDVILDQPAYFTGADLYTAQQEFMKNMGPATLEPDSQNGGMPQLKRRRAPRN